VRSGEAGTSRESRQAIDGETGQNIGFTPYSPQTTRSKKACVSSCGVKVQWPYPPAYPGTERWTSQAAVV
jgi:hypothetical protein